MYKSTTSEKPTVTWLKLSFTIYILFPIFISSLLLAMLNYKLSVYKPPLSEADTFGASTIIIVSVLQKCPPYRESTKRTKERQRQSVGVRYNEVSIKRQLTVSKFRIKLGFWETAHLPLP